MSIVTHSRQATASELAAEMDRRGAVIETLERRIAQLERALTVVRANLVRLAWEENSIMIEGIDAALGAQPLAPEPEGEWIKWAGGDCPVGDDVKVEVRFRRGNQSTPMRADMWTWIRYGTYGDVIAYRIVGAAK